MVRNIRQRRRSIKEVLWRCFQLGNKKRHKQISRIGRRDGYPYRGLHWWGIGAAETLGALATFYISVKDIKEHLKIIESKGGKVLVPFTEIPDMVKFAIFVDPAGNKIGLVE